MGVALWYAHIYHVFMCMECGKDKDPPQQQQEQQQEQQNKTAQ